jgi:hypothetical protein
MPVDISVDGFCIAKDVSYGEIRGPYSGPAGAYSFVVTTANSAIPCTGAGVFSATVPLAQANAYIGVLSLDASNNVTGLIYTADLSPIPAGVGRFEVVNATHAPLSASITSAAGTQAITVEPGALQEGYLNPSIYTSSIKDLSNNVLTGPTNVEISQRNSYLYVTAGSPANQSVQLLGPKVISGVF